MGDNIVHFLKETKVLSNRNPLKEKIINEKSLCVSGTHNSNFTDKKNEVTCLKCAKLLGLTINICKGRNIVYKYVQDNKDYWKYNQVIDEEKSSNCKQKIVNQDYCAKHQQIEEYKKLGM